MAPESAQPPGSKSAPRRGPAQAPHHDPLFGAEGGPDSYLDGSAPLDEIEDLPVAEDTPTAGIIMDLSEQLEPEKVDEPFAFYEPTFDPGQLILGRANVEGLEATTEIDLATAPDAPPLELATEPLVRPTPPADDPSVQLGFLLERLVREAGPQLVEQLVQHELRAAIARVKGET